MDRNETNAASGEGEGKGREVQSFRQIEDRAGA